MILRNIIAIIYTAKVYKVVNRVYMQTSIFTGGRLVD
jgi:hypothetical protein